MTPQGHTNKTGQAICLCNTAHSKKREDFNYTQRAEVEFRGNMVIKVYIFFFPQQTFAHLGFECNSNDNVRFKKQSYPHLPCYYSLTHCPQLLYI